MNTGSLKVFDDVIVRTTPVYSTLQHAEQLAKSDQIGIHVIVTEPVGSDLRLSVTLQHSRDGAQDDGGIHIRGQRWQPIDPTPEVDGVVHAGTTNLYGGEPWPARPRHRYLRLRIQLTGGRLVAAELSRPELITARVVILVAPRTRTRRPQPKSRSAAFAREQRALAEAQQLVADARGLPAQAMRSYVRDHASAETLAEIDRVSRETRAERQDQVDRLRRRAQQVLNLLSDE